MHNKIVKTRTIKRSKFAQQNGQKMHNARMTLYQLERLRIQQKKKQHASFLHTVIN